jgi:hypothetical protein
MESSIFKGCTFYVERREGEEYKREMLNLVEIIRVSMR